MHTRCIKRYENRKICCFNAEKWNEKVNEYRDELMEGDKYFLDERLRPGPAIDSDNLFGISGSFRKLDVD